MDSKSEEKKKVRHQYSTTEAADYLRRLADQLESGSIQLSSEEMEFEGEVKVKESLKSKAGRSRIKVQFKVSLHEHEADDEEAPAAKPKAPPKDAGKPAPVPAPEPMPAEGKPATEEPRPKESGRPSSFKELKKRMSSGLKEIRRSLQEGLVPPEDAARSFYEDCILMTTFSGNGDPDYPSFKAKAEEFWAAAQAGGLEGIQQAFDQLKAAKSSCHKQYK